MDRIQFYQTKKAFVFQTQQGDLQIDRTNSNISTEVSPGNLSALGEPTRVFGILGTIQLLNDKYLAVIKQVESVGVIFGHHEVLKVVSVEWIPFKSNVSPSYDELKYLELLKSVVDSRAFYYSLTYDMTRSVQNWHVNEKVNSEPLYKNSDSHFFWNQQLSAELIQANADIWVIPVIRGFVEIRNVQLGTGKSFKFALLTRLGKNRVGTRYNIRGLDTQGNAANYAETEQIVETEDELLSFMLLRGSIPLYWSQKTNLKYKPKIKISQKHQSSAGFKLHIDDQITRYKSLVLLNLVNLSGSEGVLAKAFETEHTNYGSDSVKYVAFDFHKKCKHTNYSALEELVTEIEQNVEHFGYFEYDHQNKSVKSEQTGIVRVNCIDCLDRTNVVESVFASHVLLKQLKLLKLIGENDEMKTYPELQKIFKNGWADNGDELSNLYAGTGALKADFTRTGQRSLRGLYNDGINSLTRYYLNNFSDGHKQDSVNLFLGKYKVDPSKPSPFQQATAPALSALKYLLFASLFMSALSTSQISSDPFRYLRHTLFWVIVSCVILFIMLKNGRKLVNKPVLKLNRTL